MEKIWIKKQLYNSSYEFLKFVPFLKYLIFKLIFLTKIVKMGVFWSTDPRMLTWRAGPPCGYDAALRPRDRAAGGPREAQEVHRARTHGRRPRVSTRVLADTRVGRQVARGVGIWRAHGLVGPGKMIGAVTR